ncbi:MAG TPA: glycosyltransferase family 39 protein, partial [Terriglobales bacterium]|nr:glycosyltransferase family 39 protein [Terriglobales bacterium]
MRQLVRQNLSFFACAGLAALALRLLFLFRFPAITADSLIYGDIARNWLQHGIYAVTDAGKIVPTFIRLPGYPAFLALVFSVFGMDHYRTAMLLQIFVDLGTCFLIADMARRLLSPRAAKAAFLLAGLCPFFANYAAAALTETWEIFFTALALDLALAALQTTQQLRVWMYCGLAIGAAILLRPDGGLLLAAIELYLAALALRGLSFSGSSPGFSGFMRAGLIVALVSLAPLIPWTLRNFYTLHRFQPLAPRYANEEHEFVPMGFNRWVKTWMADYVSVEEIYWAVPGEPIDVEKLPGRAFDSPAQQAQTAQLLSDYNQVLHITPELDKRFEALAEERIRDHPLRYYLWLPLVRITDMWLRPRTSILPSDTRWWEYNDDPRWSALAVALGVIGLFYLAAALAGLLRGRFAPHLGLLLTFVVLRSVFLGTLENPEPRYTL